MRVCVSVCLCVCLCVWPHGLHDLAERRLIILRVITRDLSHDLAGRRLILLRRGGESNPSRFDDNCELNRCLNSYRPLMSPNADAIVACITKKFEELNIEIRKLRAFVSDGASVMVGVKGGVAAKLREDFTQTMINIHCICHRLALACGDTGDNYKFIKNVEENLIGLWKFLKNSSKTIAHLRGGAKIEAIRYLSPPKKETDSKENEESVSNTLVKSPRRCRRSMGRVWWSNRSFKISG